MGLAQFPLELLNFLLIVAARLSDHDVFDTPLDLAMVADVGVMALRSEGTDLKVAETFRAPVSILPPVCLAPVLDECTLGATLAVTVIVCPLVWPNSA